MISCLSYQDALDHLNVFFTFPFFLWYLIRHCCLFISYAFMFLIFQRCSLSGTSIYKLRVIKSTRAEEPLVPALITSSNSFSCVTVGVTRQIPNVYSPKFWYSVWEGENWSFSLRVIYSQVFMNIKSLVSGDLQSSLLHFYIPLFFSPSLSFRSSLSPLLPIW